MWHLQVDTEPGNCVHLEAAELLHADHLFEAVRHGKCSVVLTKAIDKNPLILEAILKGFVLENSVAENNVRGGELGSRTSKHTAKVRLADHSHLQVHLVCFHLLCVPTSVRHESEGESSVNFFERSKKFLSSFFPPRDVCLLVDDHAVDV